MGQACFSGDGGDAGQTASQVNGEAPTPAPPVEGPPADEEPPTDLTKQVKWRYNDLPPVQEKNPGIWSSWGTTEDVLADMSKLSEDDKLRPFYIKAGEELKSYVGVEEVQKALTPQLKWMYADMGDFETAKHNPFRWSSAEGHEAIVAELQKLSDEEKKRKVCIRCSGEDRDYETINECLKIISPTVNWMFGDLSDFEYRNPFRWSGHDNLEEAYTRMQLMSEEELSRPVIVREGGKETKFEHVVKAIEELAPLVGKCGGEGTWDMAQTAELAKQGSGQPFEGKAARLHTGSCDSVHAAVEALNEGKLKCPSGICVMFSQSHDAFFMMYRTDMKATAYSTFDLTSESFVASSGE